MAKNYTFKETVKVIAEGKDFETITDIGRRYPVLVHLITAVTAKAGDDFVRLVEFLPEHLTANKVNSAIKATIAGEVVEEVEGADAAETETKEEDVKEEVKEDTVWNEKMTSKQLWEILGKAGKRKLAKSTKKADLIEACKQAFGSVEKPDEEESETEEAPETPENPYEGKTAMELFKECKSRKIKVEPKKPAKFYADLLLKDDAAKAQPEESEEDDDWGEEPEEEAAKKNTKTGKGAKPNKTAGTKKSKKEEPEESDDDEWDI